jgi:hypothetical protein
LRYFSKSSIDTPPTLVLLCWPSPSCMPPRQPVSRFQTACLTISIRPRDSSRAFSPVDRTNNSHGQPGPFTPPPLQRLRHYYEPVRQQTPTRYSIPCGFCRLGRSPSPTQVDGVGASLLPFHTEAADQDHVVYMPDTTWPISGYPPGSSRDYWDAPVSVPLPGLDTSSAVRSRSPSRSPPDASFTPLPHRSPRQSSTNAA